MLLALDAMDAVLMTVAIDLLLIAFVIATARLRGAATRDDAGSEPSRHPMPVSQASSTRRRA